MYLKFAFRFYFCYIFNISPADSFIVSVVLHSAGLLLPCTFVEPRTPWTPQPE